MKKHPLLPRRSTSLILTTTMLLAAAAVPADAVTYHVPKGQTETVNTPISGDQDLEKTGDGTLVLTASNSYTGMTLITGGTVRLTGAQAAMTSGSGAEIFSGGLVVNNGATVDTGSLWIADEQGATGSVTVQNATVTLASVLEVGGVGNGRLSVSGSSSVTVGDELIIGYFEGAEGRLTLGGSGATLNVTGDAVVGAQGSGLFRVEKGAEAIIENYFYVGLNEIGSGTVQVSGPGSSLMVYEDLILGEFGTGELSITNGGFVGTYGLIAGNSDDAFGKITVSGKGSTLEVSSDLEVGHFGSGELLVEDGATLSLGYLILGSRAGSGATAIITGTNTTVNTTGIDVGEFGEAVLWILNGASVCTTYFSVADAGAAWVVIGGKGTQVQTEHFNIGLFDEQGSDATMFVTDGARFTVSGSTRVGTGLGRNASIRVDGAVWQNDGTLELGNAFLELANGGKLTTNDEVRFLEDTVQNIFISGSKSLWHHTAGDLTFSGTTNLVLSDGGRLQADWNDLIGLGALEVEGVLHLTIGSELVFPVAPGTLDVAYIETGTSGFANITFNHTAKDYEFAPMLLGNIRVTHQAGVTNFVNTINLPEEYFIVWGGTANFAGNEVEALKGIETSYGTLNIRDGAKVEVDELLVAEFGTVKVSGSGTVLNIAEVAQVGFVSLNGDDAVSTLRIENGAVVNVTPHLLVGGRIDGLVSVKGEGSQLNVLSGLAIIGEYDDSVYQTMGTGEVYYGSGALQIADGGVVDLTASGTLYLSGYGSAVIFGAQELKKPVAAGVLIADTITANPNWWGRVIFNHSGDAENPFVFSTTVTGKVGLVHQAGVTVLDGALDPAYGITVLGGTAVLGSNATLSGTGALTLLGDTAVLDLGGHSVVTRGLSVYQGKLLNGTVESLGPVGFDEGRISAVLTGTSPLYKAGDELAILEGEQLYTGNTIVLGGTLDVRGSIVSDSYVEAGTLLVSGTAGGDVSVQGGVLVVNGTVGGSVDLQDGAVFGSGVIAQNLFNASWVQPGNSPGTLTVGGDYIQAANGSLSIEILSPKQHDRLVVGGSATLDGSLVLVLGRDPGKSSYQILTADGGVNGKFASVVNNGLFSANVFYLEDAVQVRFERESLQGFAREQKLSQNVRSLARALDRANARGQLDGLLTELYSADLDALPGMLAMLSPEALTQIFQLGFNAAQVQYNNLERRLDDVRNGVTGFSANGLSLTNPRGTLNYDGTPIVNTRDGLQLAGFDGKSLVGKQHVAPVVTESRWGFFATGSGEWADVETTAQARGSEFSTGGVTVGADYRVCNHFVIGIAGGYTNVSSDLFNGGKVEVNSGRGSVYATAFGNGFYANALVGGAYNSYKTKRNTLGGTAYGNPDGGEFNALLGGGYDFSSGGWTIGPVASLQYTYLGLSSYTEHGSLAPMHFPSQSQNSLRSQLGGRIAYAWNVNNSVVIRPEVRLQWQHEYLDSTAALESSFAGSGSVFTVNGPELGRDSLILDAGVTVQFSNRASVFANYTAEIGRKNYSSNAVSGGFRISF